MGRGIEAGIAGEHGYDFIRFDEMGWDWGHGYWLTYNLHSEKGSVVASRFSPVKRKSISIGALAKRYSSLGS